MKIKKISDEIVYKKQTDRVVFEVNGKKVEVYTSYTDDSETGDYENDQEIDEDDLKALTDEEHEIFGENLTELLELKENETTEII